MIGKYRTVITVQQLYDYAIKHNYLGADATVILDIINRERNLKWEVKESTVSPVNSTSMTDFSNLVEYSYNDLIELFNT